MIHPTADVQSENIGKNTSVWQFSIILKNAKIGDNCNINCHTFIENDVMIGKNVTIKPGVFIWDGITIEDNVMVGPNVTFTNDKLPRSKNQHFKLERTLIKNGASIGAGATILCGIEVGTFSMVGAGSVVTKSIPSRALVIGNPAKIIGWLNEDGTKMKFENDRFLDNKGSVWILDGEELRKVG